MIEITADGRACRVRRDALADRGGRTRILACGHGLRIDNRDEIAAELALGSAVGDRELLEAAWARWATGTPDRLRGAFAFALHDPDRGAVFLARDVFGLSPLFYYLDEHDLAVAADSPTLRAMLGKPLANDDLMLSDFVAGMVVERERTFFEGVQRLPPAHWFSINADSVVREAYWSLGDVPAERNPADPSGRFRALFDRSVARCVANDAPILQLSGGLDSSAIAASWSAQSPTGDRLPALALTYRQTPGWCDEGHLASVAAATRADVTEIAADGHDPLADIPFWLEAVDGPYLPCGHSVSFQLLPLARRQGAHVVLSGHGGDEIVSYGFGRLNELARADRWWRLWRESRGMSGVYGENRLSQVARYLAHFELYRRVYRRFRRPSAPVQPADAGFLDPMRVAQIDAARYVARPAASRLDHDERMLHEEALGLALQPLSLEVFALCSHAAGVETRLPFYDRELLELSLSLPSDWKLRDGLSRYVIRDAFRDRLPASVLARRDKFDFAPAFVAGLVANREKVLDLTDPATPGFAGLVNLDRLRCARESLTRNGTGIAISHAFFLWRVAVLHLWFDVSRRELDPIVLLPLDDD